MKSAKFVISNSDVHKCPEGNLPEYAFIGRSNVGKSSLINMLTNKKGLAMTSQKPGKTLLINHFLINDDWYREQLTCLFVLLDCRHEAQKIDLEFMEWLGENGVPFAIIFTKTDKISKGRLADNIKLYQKRLLETWEELPPILTSSSETKNGKEEILGFIENINKGIKENVAD